MGETSTSSPLEREEGRPHDEVEAMPAKPSGMTLFHQIFQSVDQVTPYLADLISEFWGVSIQCQCFSVSHRNLYFWRNDAFQVTQVQLGELPQQSVQLRLSDGACSSLLTETLGQRRFRPEQFRFNRLTYLEADLLKRFGKQVLSLFYKELLDQKPKWREKTRLVHVVWLLRVQHYPIGKLMLTLPLEALLLDAPPLVSAHFDEEEIAHAHVPCVIEVGQTRMRMAELKQLERDDIVLLEESDVRTFCLKLDELDARLPFEPDLTRQQAGLSLLELEDLESLDEMERLSMRSQKEPSKKQRSVLWNELQVEVCAEFYPTKFPLRQLKQMAEGLIVEIGDLTQNQVRLHVEGKTVAQGELVIVGDKFGIRIQRVGDAIEDSQYPPRTVQLPSSKARHPEIEHSGYMSEPEIPALPLTLPARGEARGEVSSSEEMHDTVASESDAGDEDDLFGEDDFASDSFDDDEDW